MGTFHWENKGLVYLKMITRNQEMAVYFGPNQLMLTNTNNRTEYLNHALKTEELVNYKKVFFMWNAERYNRKFPSVVVSSPLNRTEEERVLLILVMNNIAVAHVPI